ncbi:MAG: YdbL family protein [bacterium]|nr:YdbL family protein [bacterium]MCP5066665.1 YdbL family protein [bacterium]
MMIISNERRRNSGWQPTVWVLAMACSMFLLAATASSAGELDAARDAGVVGERRNGYIGLVVENPTEEQAALVKRVNTARRAQYRKVADKSGATVEQVAASAAERLIREAKSGNYVQGADDGWVRKP